METGIRHGRVASQIISIASIVITNEVLDMHTNPRDIEMAAATPPETPRSIDQDTTPSPPTHPRTAREENVTCLLWCFFIAVFLMEYFLNMIYIIVGAVQLSYFSPQSIRKVCPKSYLWEYTFFLIFTFVELIFFYFKKCKQEIECRRIIYVPHRRVEFILHVMTLVFFLCHATAVILWGIHELWTYSCVKHHLSHTNLFIVAVTGWSSFVFNMFILWPLCLVFYFFYF